MDIGAVRIALRIPEPRGASLPALERARRHVRAELRLDELLSDPRQGPTTALAAGHLRLCT
jgi:hypothetical protein